jgi:hypothetical protein
MEKPEALTTLCQNMINFLNIRTPDHLPCQSELARGGQGVRFFHSTTQTGFFSQAFSEDGKGLAKYEVTTKLGYSPFRSNYA